MFKKLFEFFFSEKLALLEKTTSDYRTMLDAVAVYKLELEEEQKNPVTSDDSYITFTISNDLKVSIHSKVNKDIIPALIDNDVIIAEESGNVDIVQMALVVIANESSEQIIMGINNHEN